MTKYIKKKEKKTYNHNYHKFLFFFFNLRPTKMYTFILF